VLGHTGSLVKRVASCPLRFFGARGKESALQEVVSQRTRFIIFLAFSSVRSRIGPAARKTFIAGSIPAVASV